MIKVKNNLIKGFGFMVVLTLVISISPITSHAYVTQGAYKVSAEGSIGNTGSDTGSTGDNANTTTQGNGENTGGNTAGESNTNGDSSVNTLCATAAGSIICNTGENTEGNTGEITDAQTASAIDADKGGLAPNSILGWLILFGIIYIIVKIWRWLTRTKREKEVPLKKA